MAPDEAHIHKGIFNQMSVSLIDDDYSFDVSGYLLQSLNEEAI